ncbi:hypothetical protein R1flu_013227 [Riccia fluitans]|uniref:Secreted protein n=1 Tax=Riccia fluitans TaxID=41844 RepID=A0ABD1YCM9_9MARC
MRPMTKLPALVARAVLRHGNLPGWQTVAPVAVCVQYSGAETDLLTTSRSDEAPMRRPPSDFLAEESPCPSGVVRSRCQLLAVGQGCVG